MLAGEFTDVLHRARLVERRAVVGSSGRWLFLSMHLSFGQDTVRFGSGVLYGMCVVPVGVLSVLRAFTDARSTLLLLFRAFLLRTSPPIIPRACLFPDRRCQRNLLLFTSSVAGGQAGQADFALDEPRPLRRGVRGAVAVGWRGSRAGAAVRCLYAGRAGSSQGGRVHLLLVVWDALFSRMASPGGNTSCGNETCALCMPLGSALMPPTGMLLRNGKRLADKTVTAPGSSGLPSCAHSLQQLDAAPPPPSLVVVVSSSIRCCEPSGDDCAADVQVVSEHLRPIQRGL